MPGDSTIAPPANYMLFAVSGDGRPSQAIYIGLGGATPAAAPFYDPPVNPILASGTYTITTAARAGCAANYLSYPTCATSNQVQMDVQGSRSSLKGQYVDIMVQTEFL